MLRIVLLCLATSPLLIACDRPAPDREGSTVSEPESAEPEKTDDSIDLAGPAWSSTYLIYGLTDSDVWDLEFPKKDENVRLFTPEDEPFRYEARSASYKFFGPGTGKFSARYEGVQELVHEGTQSGTELNRLKFVVPYEIEFSFEWKLEDDRLFIIHEDGTLRPGDTIYFVDEGGERVPMAEGLERGRWVSAGEGSEVEEKLLGILREKAENAKNNFPDGSTQEFEVERLSDSRLRLTRLDDHGEPGDAFTLKR